MAYNLKVSFEPKVFFFGTTLDTIDKDPVDDPDSEVESDELPKSFTLHNLTEEFIRGVYTVLYDISNDEQNFDELELISDSLHLQFPLDNILECFGDGFRDYLDPDQHECPEMEADLKSLNIIDYYNKYWKRYILREDPNEVHEVKVPSKRYVLEFEWSELSYVLQCDTVDYINGIVTAMSWLKNGRFFADVAIPHIKLGHIHDNHRLAEISIKYSINVSHQTAFNQIREILDFALASPLIGIIQEYLPNMCSEEQAYVSNDYDHKLDLVESERFIKCNTIREFGYNLCPVCRKDKSVVSKSKIYTASVDVRVVT